jgi:phytoene desaturase (3,4-didehydrolycopene-forming)
MFAHARVPAASPRAAWRRSPARSSRAVVRASIAEPSPPAAAAKAGDKQTAIVVGGGVGGLGMASRLAHAGYDVTILEKNLDTGGRCRSESFEGKGEGYRFDTGPSLMLLPDRYREQFTAVGKNLHDYMDIERVDPAYRAHFGDHTTLDLLYDTEKMRAQLDAVEEGAGGRYIDWLGRARASLDYGVAAFIEKDANSILDFVDLRRVGPLALAVNPVDLLLPQFNQMAKYFKNEKLRALFSYQELYVGLSPYNAPGVFSLLAATELTDGVWYPIGGFDKVRQSLQKLADEEGVKTRLGAEVSKIVTEPLPDETGSAIKGSKATQRVTGVRLESGEFLNADVVVANPDLPCVWEQMIDHETFPEAKKEAERWEDAEYSCSVIEFNWCLDETVPDLLHHNVFLSGDYKGSWERPAVVEDFAAPKQHNFYCHNPVYTDKSCAPEGGASVMVLLPVANINEQAKICKKRGLPVPSEEDMVNAAREAVLRRFKEAGKDIEKNIVSESVTTPSQWQERFNIKHGAVFGLSHGLTQLAAFRPPVRTGIPQLDSPEVDGLHFVGASTRPGNGVPLVLMGVKVVFEKIMELHGAGVKATKQ